MLPTKGSIWGCNNELKRPLSMAVHVNSRFVRYISGMTRKKTHSSNLTLNFSFFPQRRRRPVVRRVAVAVTPRTVVPTRTSTSPLRPRSSPTWNPSWRATGQALPWRFAPTCCWLCSASCWSCWRRTGDKCPSTVGVKGESDREKKREKDGESRKKKNCQRTWKDCLPDLGLPVDLGKTLIL